MCSSHSYGDLDSWSCKPCPETCLTCVKGGCTSCKVDFFLKGKQCVHDCDTLLSVAPYLRLSGSSSPYEGLLEVRYQGAWHSVCNDLFGLNDARVFCRELGYGAPVTYDHGEYGESVGDVLVDDLQCTGNEKSFVECLQRRWFDGDCSHSEDIGLSCSPAPVTNIRSWGSCVHECRDGLFKSKANTCELCNGACVTCTSSANKCTACREPYYLNGTTCSLGCPSGYYPNASRRACLPCAASRGCLTCEGSPDHCLSCPSSMLHNGTKCLASCSANTYRKYHTCVHDCGVMYYANTTSHVCHACPLNCRTCVVLNKVTCVACVIGYALNAGNNCTRNCSNGHVFAPIALKADDNPLVRLVNLAGSRFYGRLEVRHEDVWGTVCDDRWSLRNADVVCGQLLLGTPKVSLYVGLENLNASKFWLDDVSCLGDEESIVQCKHGGWGNNNCGAHESVHLRCNAPGVSSCEKQCPSGYFATAGFCEPCADGCVSCLLANNCSKCADGLRLGTTGTCIDRCPHSQYATADHRCNQCNSSCTTCEGGSSEDCTSCQSPYFISGNRCVLNCPPRKFKRVQPSKISLLDTNRESGGIVTVSHLSRASRL